WTVAWCDIDLQYVMSDDSKAIDETCVNGTNGKGYNVSSSRLTSASATDTIAGTVTSCMGAYGIENQNWSSANSSSSCLGTWKGVGQICLGNTLWMGISRHVYMQNGFGGSGNLCYTDRQKAFDGSFIKSTDFGFTWDAPPPFDVSSPLVQFPG